MATAIANTNALRRIPVTLYALTPEGEPADKEFVGYSARLTPANRETIRGTLEHYQGVREKALEAFTYLNRYNALEGEEKEEYERQNKPEILADIAKAQRRSLELGLEEARALARDIIDTEHRLTADQAAWVASDADSVFWLNQDPDGLEAFIKSFRGRVRI